MCKNSMVDCKENCKFYLGIKGSREGRELTGMACKQGLGEGGILANQNNFFCLQLYVKVDA